MRTGPIAPILAVLALFLSGCISDLADETSPNPPATSTTSDPTPPSVQGTTQLPDAETVAYFETEAGEIVDTFTWLVPQNPNVGCDPLTESLATSPLPDDIANAAVNIPDLILGDGYLTLLSRTQALLAVCSDTDKAIDATTLIGRSFDAIDERRQRLGLERSPRPGDDHTPISVPNAEDEHDHTHNHTDAGDAIDANGEPIHHHDDGHTH